MLGAAIQCENATSGVPRTLEVTAPTSPRPSASSIARANAFTPSTLFVSAAPAAVVAVALAPGVVVTDAVAADEAGVADALTSAPAVGLPGVAGRSSPPHGPAARPTITRTNTMLGRIRRATRHPLSVARGPPHRNADARAA